MKPVSVTNACLAGGGDRVVWGAGLFALGRFADSVGLTGALSDAVPPSGERAPVHDRGAVLVHALLTAAAGGEACSDIEHLRAQPELFGDVASDSTLYRTITALDANGPEALGGAAAQVREQVWADRDRSGPLVLDIDSTLVEIHSENKAGAAPHYKGGYGFHPMICSTADGEPLWVKLRPGNAAANHIGDHLEVLDAAVDMLPGADAAGHRDSDDSNLAERALVVRIDAGGCTAGRYPTETLTSHVRDNQWLTYEEAHRRLSALPAQLAGFRDRRLIRHGGPADVLVYDPENLEIGPNEVVHDLPGGEWRRIQKASGYRSIIVNGQETISDDTQTETHSGQLLRHGG